MTLEASHHVPTLLSVIRRWRELRAEGIPAGSAAREMTRLRKRLLRAGLIDVVYNGTIAAMERGNRSG